jgi:hypothetical protein
VLPVLPLVLVGVVVYLVVGGMLNGGLIYNLTFSGVLPVRIVENKEKA